MLLFSQFSNKRLSLEEQYNQQCKMYEHGAYWVILNNINVFGPYPKNENVPWDISLMQSYVQNELKDLIKWVNTNIVLQLGRIANGNVSRKTYGVLLRIATGMLNKTNIPEEYKTIFHANMIHNLHSELNAILDESLPF